MARQALNQAGASRASEYRARQLFQEALIAEGRAANGAERAERYTTDREYRTNLVTGKAWEKAKGK
jgi:hypothetical protein